MNDWLLDTNILSELRKPKPEEKVVEFVAAQPLDRLYVSTVTFAEIRFGIEKLADAGKRSEINLWLQNKLRPMFASRILDGERGCFAEMASYHREWQEEGTHVLPS